MGMSVFGKKQMKPHSFIKKKNQTQGSIFHKECLSRKTLLKLGYEIIKTE